MPRGRVAKVAANRVRLLGDEVLRQQCTEIKKIPSKTSSILKKELFRQIRRNRTPTTVACGIAAPQVGYPLRAFAMLDIQDLERREQAGETFADNEPLPLKIYFNPEILQHSEELEEEYESCLSVPGLTGLVSRPNSVKVKYTTEDNETVEEELHNYEARVFQHEYDHLEGIVYLDRVQDSLDMMMEDELVRQLEEDKQKEAESESELDSILK